ncbi:hypothetical protein FRC12_015630 [Ceratobasidium sp. 428]|nr:hypothetical protein FRC12_015630 [Ceratobasidium sp. 428]
MGMFRRSLGLAGWEEFRAVGTVVNRIRGGRQLAFLWPEGEGLAQGGSGIMSEAVFWKTRDSNTPMPRVVLWRDDNQPVSHPPTSFPLSAFAFLLGSPR